MNLYETLKARVIYRTTDQIKKEVEKYPSIYSNPSHFVRCAIQRELNRSKKNEVVIE